MKKLIFSLSLLLTSISYAGIRINGTTCLDVSSDRIYHDTDCDGTKDGTEEFIDQVGGGGGSSSLQVKEADVEVSSPTASIDFDGDQFNVTEDPSLEVNVELNPSSVTLLGASIEEAEISDLAHTTDTGPSPDCSGTTTYQDGEGNCDTVGGDVSGGLDALAVTDDSHAHTGSTLSGIDISDDTNLAVTSPVVLTGDTVSVSSNVVVSTGATFATGDVLYWDGTRWNRLAIGNEGEVLEVAAGGIPEWDTDNTGSGGSGTTIEVEDGGSSIVNTSTVNFNGSQFVVTDDSGEALVALNSSSVTLAGGFIESAEITDDTITFSDVDHTITIGGNPGLAASQAYWSSTGIIFEGSSDDTLEGLLTSANITGTDKTWTLQNATGLIYQTAGADVSVSDGGTGTSSLTDGGIMLGSGTGAVTVMSVLADGEIVVGDGTTDPVALAAFTSSTGDLIHEAGGLEADVSAFSGLLAIASGATAEVDAKSELEAQIADVTDFAEADGDIFTGAHDFGGADSLEIPNATAGTINATGEITYDTTDNVLAVYDGTFEQVIGYSTHSFTLTISSGTGWDSLVIPVWMAPHDMDVTITRIRASTVGTSTVTFQLEERAWNALQDTGTDVFTVSRSTANDSGEEYDTSDFANPQLAAGSHLVFVTDTGTEAGAADLATVTVFYRRLRE